VSCKYGSELSGCIKHGQFFEKLKNYSLPRGAVFHGVGWLVGWLVDLLVCWLVDLLVVVWLVGLLVGWLIGLFVGCLVGLLVV